MGRCVDNVDARQGVWHGRWWGVRTCQVLKVLGLANLPMLSYHNCKYKHPLRGKGSWHLIIEPSCRWNIQPVSCPCLLSKYSHLDTSQCLIICTTAPGLLSACQCKNGSGAPSNWQPLRFKVSDCWDKGGGHCLFCCVLHGVPECHAICCLVCPVLSCAVLFPLFSVVCYLVLCYMLHVEKKTVPNS